ncbi:MAG TPA: nucleotidyltransferase family protein [Burkholderiaceae bacterium]|nr:nucleotidyltransferase family protein [Burkholderiaceae bacterium]HRP27401.1 nucleotidyltransferase family protein [Burkholderiaceae bacterium]
MMSGPVVVVLAAGRGSRFRSREHKLMQPLGSSTVLGATLRHVLASRMPMVVVATASIAEVAGRSIATRDIVVVPEVGETGSQTLGMGYSIACGVGARPDASGWLVLPGDMPMVRPDTLLAVAHALEQHTIAYAQYRGRRGHPVGFAAELFSELATLSGDAGARRLLARYPAQGIEVDDPGALIDIDTADDLDSLRSGVVPSAPQIHY